ncbi:CHAT domain-containing protein [Intrasporangium calvum]|uniref:CHAT domain-containing protein n=1 Tax=Intrasporangium calvum TaxID=53358 RepID=UPI000DF5E6B4|nr:CHAT domain-containing protein [Intrasporangium calvum]AXG13034.1 CHAT domain-containing protein [Intrasporangium calvum]
MERDYLDFEVSIENTSAGQGARVTSSPAGTGTAPFVLPFTAVELAQFMTAVGPPRIASRRLVPAETRVTDVREYGKRLGDALFAGEVDRLFRESLSSAKQQGLGLRVRLALDAAPDLEPVPWEYLYDSELGRFLTLSSQTPIVRSLDALDVPAAVRVAAPLRVLVMISSPSDLPQLAVAHEEELLRATTADLVASGRLELVVLTEATLTGLQRALLDTFHVFHFIGHGGFDQGADEGVLVLEREDGTGHRVGASRLGTLLHDANGMQLVVLNACEGARTSGRDAFSGVAQAIVRQGLPSVVAMQTEISDRAALVFSHEFYYFLTRGLPIDAAICEVRKAMATSDESAEWGTAVLVRSGSGQPFDVSALGRTAEPAPEGRLESLYAAAQSSLGSATPEAAVPILEQIASERPDYADVTTLLEAVKGGPGAAPPEGPVSAARRAEVARAAVARQAEAARREEEARQAEEARAQRDLLEPEREQQDRSARGRAPGGSSRAAGRIRPARVVRVVLWLVVLGAGFLAWRLLPTLMQRAEPLVDLACGSPAASAPPRTSFSVGCAPVAPVVDGEFDDWRSVTTHPVTAVVDRRGGVRDGLSSTWKMLWDKDALFLYAAVTDSRLTAVRTSDPGSFWTGDGVSFEFGPDPRPLGANDPLRPGRDLHVLIGLVDDGNRGARAAINRVSKGRFAAGDDEPSIVVARRDTADGYQLEARVPWRTLGLSIAPARGTVVGMNLNVSDAERAGTLKAMLSSNPDRTARAQNHPAQWQTVLLADAG